MIIPDRARILRALDVVGFTDSELQNMNSLTLLYVHSQRMKIAHRILYTNVETITYNDITRSERPYWITPFEKRQNRFVQGV